MHRRGRGCCLSLIPYLIHRNWTLQELLADEGSYVNCTKANCEIRYRILSDYESQVSDPEQLEILRQERLFYLENYGRGLVYKPAPPAEDLTFSPARSRPRQIVLLTDTFCENEGEDFVAMCRRCSEHITTLGRPTMGTSDYFDPITVALNDHMTLSYPIAMTAAAYRGEGIAEKGLPVDVYIPWTPEEIHRDILLEKALAL